MKPYITFIAASRNDGHGGDLLKRMKLFIEGLLLQANKFELDIELIIVEWNADPLVPLLNEALPKPEQGSRLSLRYILVPPSVHGRYRFSKELGLYQMIAKNVGIRHAKADYILCTNIDLLFSDSLMQKLAEKKLKKNVFYRANRCDIPANFDANMPFNEMLQFAERNVIRRLGFKEQIYMSHWPPFYFKKFMFPGQMNKLAKRVRSRYLKPAEFELLHLDTMACGDFTLMHKDMWFKLKGYAELDLYSIHIDSLCLIAAKALGYEQVVFPSQACTYHIDHYNGWESMSPVEKIGFVNQRPGIGWDVVKDAGIYLIENKAELGFNDENWGLADEHFEEIVFNSFE